MRMTLSLLAAAGLIGMVVDASPAAAQAARTFVSSIGSDSNPCSVSQPCRTFQKAHDSTAANGEIVALSSAGYGTLTISKSITISAIGVEAAITTAAGQTAITINAGAADTVVLRGLTLIGGQAGTTGILAVSAQAVIVNQCSIGGFTGTGILGGGGLVNLTVADSNLLFNGSTGIRFAPDNGGSVANAELINNRVGGSATGIEISSQGGVTVTASLNGGSAFGNQDGVRVTAPAAGPPATALLSDFEASNNSAHGLSATGATATIYLNRTNIYGNGNGLNASNGGMLVSFNNNAISGNVIDGAPTSTVALK